MRPTSPSTTRIRWARGKRFIDPSRRRASSLLPQAHCHTTTTGRRDRVERAPRPLLCASTRFARSLLMPMYKEASAHDAMYTVQDSGFRATVLSNL